MSTVKFFKMEYEKLEQAINKFNSGKKILDIQLKYYGAGEWVAMVVYEERDLENEIDEALDHFGLPYALNIIEKISQRFPIFCHDLKDDKLLDISSIKPQGQSCIKIVLDNAGDCEEEK